MWLVKTKGVKDIKYAQYIIPYLYLWHSINFILNLQLWEGLDI